MRPEPSLGAGVGGCDQRTQNCLSERSFLGDSDGKKSACNAGDLGSIPGLGRSPGEEGMATHSSILAWRLPQTEEPGKLQSMRSHRVGHD